MADGMTKRDLYHKTRTWLGEELFDAEHESAELESDLDRIYSLGVNGGAGSVYWTVKLCLEAAFKAGFRRGKTNPTREGE